MDALLSVRSFLELMSKRLRNIVMDPDGDVVSELLNEREGHTAYRRGPVRD